MILIQSGSLSFPDALRPPLEARRRADEIRTRLEGDTALCLGLLEFVDGGEMAVVQHSVGQWPEVLGRLEFGRVRRQEQQMEVIRHAQLEAFVPASAIEDQHDLLGGASTHLAGERLQLDFKERDRDTRGQVKDGAARGGMDEAHQVAPVIAMLHRRERAVAIEAPHFVQDRLQPNAVLVNGPEFNGGLREGRSDRLDERAELFLNSACCSGSAWTCRGRGLRRLPWRRTR